MSAEHLELVLPDWCEMDTVRRSPVPFALWTIGDQCLLHHWLDHAVNQGVSSVHVFAADRPAVVRRLLDESSLWPVKIDFTAIATTAAAPATAIHVDWLPGAAAPPNTVCLDIAGTGQEKGGGQNARATDGPGILPAASNIITGAKSTGLAAPPAPTNGWELIARAAAMEQAWLERMAAAPDYHLVSIGYSCKIHPAATLIAPYFIGDNVFIGPGCEIGPYAVIGSGSMIAGANCVAHSHVAADSFLGPVTALDHCLLDHGILFNLKHQVRLDQIESHLVASLDKPACLVPLKDRLCAVLLYLRLGAPAASTRSFVTIDGRTLPGDPAAGLSNRAAWLPLVWQGKLPLYGVLPRTTEQLDGLVGDWRDVLRHAPIGVFSYADSQGCHTPADPEEAVHAVYQATLPAAALSAAIVHFTRSLKAADLTPSPRFP
ncbi:MAG: hypothetical protein WCP45_12715 [Verrucomicrobiota bacterium]